MAGSGPAVRIQGQRPGLSALRGGVDDVVPVGLSGRSSPPEGDVWRDLQPFAQGLGLAVPGLVGVLGQDDGPDVWEGAGGEADLFALASRGRSSETGAPSRRGSMPRGPDPKRRRR